MDVAWGAARRAVGGGLLMIVGGGVAGAPDGIPLDASVLFPAALRDRLLRAARRGLFRPLWTEEILEEVRRNLVRDLGLSLD